jgi:hypothetical protein
MQDLEIAKKRLIEKHLTLSVVKNGNAVFEATSHGVSNFLTAIEKFGSRFDGASVADKVVGKAIALLCVYAKVKAVYGVILSKRGKAVFEENMVHHGWSTMVENILDAEKTGICPFEKLAAEISDPKDAYRRLKALQDSLERCR